MEFNEYTENFKIFTYSIIIIFIILSITIFLMNIKYNETNLPVSYTHKSYFTLILLSAFISLWYGYYQNEILLHKDISLISEEEKDRKDFIRVFLTILFMIIIFIFVNIFVEYLTIL